MHKSTTKELHQFQHLLTSNAKLRKRRKRYHAIGLTLAPAKTSGRNVCPESGFCANICVLWFTGRMVMQPSRQAALARTKLFFDDRATFITLLEQSIQQHLDTCRKQHEQPAVRLNAASDISWERIAPNIFRDFPAVQFYDYTKITKRAMASSNQHWPENYSLTYSISERSCPWKTREILQSGVNCSLVTDSEWNPQQNITGKLPKTVLVGGRYFPTVDGDEHDIRIPELDGTGSVVLLRGKGSVANVLEGIRAGFIRRVRGGRASTHELMPAA
jgi:hypothetical protein